MTVLDQRDVRGLDDEIELLLGLPLARRDDWRIVTLSGGYCGQDAATTLPAKAVE